MADFSVVTNYLVSNHEVLNCLAPKTLVRNYLVRSTLVLN